MRQHYHINDFIFFVRQRSSDIPILKEVITNDNYGIKGKLKAHDVVIDIGGHIGSFSVFAASMGTVVLTYEAVKRNFDLLKENVEINGFPNNIHNMGVMGTEGKRRIYVRAFNYGGSNFYNPNSDPEWYEDVECTTLDKIFQENHLDHCDFLKMDCEGAELEILESFSNRQLLKTISLEYHGADRRDAIFKLLEPTHNLIGDQSNDLMGTVTFTLK